MEKTLENPLDCKEIQSILKEISPGCSLEGLMLKLKLQYFGDLMQRTDSLEKTLILGKIEGRRRRGRQRIPDIPVFTREEARESRLHPEEPGVRLQTREVERPRLCPRTQPRPSEWCLKG